MATAFLSATPCGRLIPRSLPPSLCGSPIRVASVRTVPRRPRRAILRAESAPGAPPDAPPDAPTASETEAAAPVFDADVEGASSVDIPSTSKDVAWTVAWVAVAAAVAGGFGYFEGSQRALEFVAGYLIEYSLSVDNLFVFLLIFSSFKVPRKSQERVLTYGIVTAFALRGFMIVLGTELTRQFEFVTVAFAVLLLYSGAKLLLGEEEEDGNIEDNGIVKFSRKLLPFSDKYDGQNFFTMENGVRVATPLLLVLVCIELSDVVFALDSVPAVLGISDDTKVVYLSNILAIMGLRNLYFILAGALGGLRFLQPALGILLTFVGGKMGAETLLHWEVGIVPSLLVIASVLGGGIGLSLAFPEDGSGETESSSK